MTTLKGNPKTSVQIRKNVSAQSTNETSARPEPAPKGKHMAGYVFHSLSVCAGCGCSGDDFGSANVEAFEATGELYCEDCAEGAIVRASSEDEL